MNQSSRVCPRCRKLNSASDQKCYYCGAPFPGKVGSWVQGGVTSALGREQPAARFFLILCSAIYVVLASRGKFSFLGGIPEIEALRWGAWGRFQEPWRYLSAMFVHFGVLHIFFNMLTLHDLGKMLEPRLGSGRFTVAFLATGIAGFLASDLWYTWRGAPALTAGASGGLLGLIGVLVGVLYARRDPAWKQVLVRVLVYGAIFALALPANNAAHLGGLVSGCLLGYWYGVERRVLGGIRSGWYNVLATLLVLASLASIVASHVTVNDWIRERQQQERRRWDL